MGVGIIGAGPAGLMAAIAAAENGAHVTVFEKNTLPGRKLLMTGNGRCNVTNRMSIDRYPEQYFGNGKFLYRALHAFSPEEVERFFEASGVQLIEENQGRVFPKSGRASDILSALTERAEHLGVRMEGLEKALDIRRSRSGRVVGVVTEKGIREINACALCTGGETYPTTGSTGDGAVIAHRLGHTIIPHRPALAPLDIAPNELPELPGVVLHNVRTTILQGNKAIARRSGDVLFTHHGLSGPAVLPLARFLPTDPSEYAEGIRIELDLWPDSKETGVKDMMMRRIESNRNMKMIQIFREYFPVSFLVHLFERAGVSDQVFARDLRREDRKKLQSSLRGLSYRVCRPPMFSTAMVTAGGVSLREIDPGTMESRLVEGLFFAGEVLDIDGESGGFNLQAAFSTGFLAGRSAAEFAAKSRTKHE